MKQECNANLKNIYNDLMDGFIKHYANEEMPVINERTTARAILLARNSPIIKMKARSMTDSVMHIITKHIED